jgi:hypothetical protein
MQDNDVYLYSTLMINTWTHQIYCPFACVLTVKMVKYMEPDNLKRIICKQKLKGWPIFIFQKPLRNKPSEWFGNIFCVPHQVSSRYQITVTMQHTTWLNKETDNTPPTSNNQHNKCKVFSRKLEIHVSFHTIQLHFIYH